MDHKWPIANEQHLWGDWMQANRTDAPGGATQYRQCVHPKCNAKEERKAPLA